MRIPEKLLEVLQDKRLELAAIADRDRVIQLLQEYLNQWEKWNPRINLTSEQDATVIIEKHIYDSLQYARAVQDGQWRVMDIGSGAGFPGIPLKVIFPQIKMVLVESQRKRANFLRTCVRALSLTEIAVLNQRAEEIDRIWFEKFDLVIFRGVGEISKCLKLAVPFLKPGGQAVMKKDPEAEFPQPMETGGYLLELKREILVEGKTGVPSKLMLFEKCST